MKRIAGLVALMLVSGSSFAGLIEGDNYSSDDALNYWTNHDLSLDIARLDWADTLGGDRSEQKSFGDYNAYLDTNDQQWRWATGDEFWSLVNWFDTDANNAGWSEAQNEGTNLFFSLNGFGSKFFGTGPNGEVYQDGFDHEGYTYWQFGTMVNDAFEFNWVADFGDQVDGVSCPDWSVLCHSGFLDAGSSLGFTASFAIELEELNIAPLLVRNVGQLNPQNDPSVTRIPEPSTVILSLLGGLGLMRLRRS